MNKDKIVQAIIKQGVLPLYYHSDEDRSIRILQSLYAAGIRVVEYTNRGKQALKNFRSLKKETYKQCPDLILGLGTVLDTKAAAKGIQNGADFLVSPGYIKEVSKFSYDENILWIPGCMTPTDLIQAKDDGLSFVKIFPANVVGPGFVKSVKELFPELLFMPTGGVDNGNLKEWFDAGVSAVGMGSSLISKKIIDGNDFDLLKANTRELLSLIAAIRSA